VGALVVQKDCRCICLCYLTLHHKIQKMASKMEEVDKGCSKSSGLSMPPPPSSAVFTPSALSAATLPVYIGLGQALNNAGLHTQWLFYDSK